MYTHLFVEVIHLFMKRVGIHREIKDVENEVERGMDSGTGFNVYGMITTKLLTSSSNVILLPVS